MDIRNGTRVQVDEDRFFVFLWPSGGDSSRVVRVGIDGSGQRTEAPAQTIPREAAIAMTRSMVVACPLDPSAAAELTALILADFQTYPDVHDLLSGAEDSRYRD
jgi:hypothetical protein